MCINGKIGERTATLMTTTTIVFVLILLFSFDRNCKNSFRILSEVRSAGPFVALDISYLSAVKCMSCFFKIIILRNN